MNYKKLLSIVFITAIIFACDAPKGEENKEVKEPKMENTEKATPGATRFEELKGYFIRNTVGFDKNVEFVAVSGEDKFNKYFGVGKTMNNEVTPLDFKKFNVAAILLKPSKTAQEIKMIRFTAEGAKQIVEFKVISGKEQNFTSTGLLLFKIPKSRISVDFVNGDTVINIPVK